MTIKFIKLINNERINTKLTAAKACDNTSTDTCIHEDNADCTAYSTDKCGKDYAACYDGSMDICSQIDESVCSHEERDIYTQLY